MACAIYDDRPRLFQFYQDPHALTSAINSDSPRRFLSWLRLIVTVWPGLNTDHSLVIGTGMPVCQRYFAAWLGHVQLSQAWCLWEVRNTWQDALTRDEMHSVDFVSDAAQNKDITVYECTSKVSSPLLSRQTTLKWRCTDVDATFWRRIDVNTTSFQRHVPAWFTKESAFRDLLFDLAVPKRGFTLQGNDLHPEEHRQK